MLRKALLVAGMLSVTAAAQAAEPGKFFSDGKAGFDLRYRFETVDQDGILEEAEASTLRMRMTLSSGVVAGFSGVAEVDDVETVFSDDYNSTRNGKTQYPQVADPTGFDLNQLYVQYAGLPKTVVRLGRQRIKLDNERFIGGVAWRQNEQTFDAFLVENKGLSKTTLTYGYIDEVRRIFGPDDGSPPASLDAAAHVLNARVAGLPIGNFTAYDYYLDIETQPQLASNTVGMRLDGSRKITPTASFTYALEYARQTDVGDNPAQIDAYYSLLEIGAKVGAVGVNAGYEVLSGEAGTYSATLNPAFQTPLATLHKFQGWADKFLTTPSAGIRDYYL
ncbi:MAG: alginate export family protein, partial [Gammaproteobacteria bacterium]|nr:alginate export family protein [Gammaproteobacteria bacterium]